MGKATYVFKFLSMAKRVEENWFAYHAMGISVFSYVPSKHIYFYFHIMCKVTPKSPEGCLPYWLVANEFLYGYPSCEHITLSLVSDGSNDAVCDKGCILIRCFDQEVKLLKNNLKMTYVEEQHKHWKPFCIAESTCHSSISLTNVAALSFGSASRMIGNWSTRWSLLPALAVTLVPFCTLDFFQTDSELAG